MCMCVYIYTYICMYVCVLRAQTLHAERRGPPLLRIALLIKDRQIGLAECTHKKASIHPSTYPPTNPAAHPSILASICLSMCLSFVSVCIQVYLCVCLCASLHLCSAQYACIIAEGFGLSFSWVGVTSKYKKRGLGVWEQTPQCVVVHDGGPCPYLAA